MLTQALLVLALTSSPVVASIHMPAHDSVAPRRHTTFGVAIAPVSESFRRLDYLLPGEGVVIAQVQAGSAAEAAKLQSGDIILGIDGKRVDETTLYATIREVGRGKAFRVEYLRNNGWHETWVTIDA